jgi:hypothetical protein
MWKGLDLAPGREFDIPEALQEIVARHDKFELIEQRRGPGRPPKVRDGDQG